MQKLNRIVLLLLQDVMKPVNKTVNGEKVVAHKHVYHKVEFSADTDEVVDSASLSDWLIAKLAEYQMLQKIQGRACFDQTLGIDISINVTDFNGETVTKSSGIKFTTNAKALSRMFDQYRGALARILNPQATAFTSDVNKRVEMKKSTMYLMEGSLNTLLAAAVPVSNTAVNEAGKIEVDVEKETRRLKTAITKAAKKNQGAKVIELKRQLAELLATVPAADVVGEGIEGVAIVNGVEVPA